MTREDIIRMAKESQVWPEFGQLVPRVEVFRSSLERFAALVAAHEREACAELAFITASNDEDGEAISEAIRDRGKL